MGNKLCKIALLTSLLVVTLGALTRLMDAGLGCPDWPLCYGHITPPDSTIAFINPEKAWLEMIHRYLAGALGILILLIAITFETDKTVSNKTRWLSRLLLILVIVQALFGMLTVTMKLWPQVVTLHLLGGMAVLALLWLLVLQSNSRQPASLLPQLKPWALALLLLLSAQIALGGWTSSNYAGLACPDFPTCQQRWLPQLTLSEAFDITTWDGRNHATSDLSAQARVTIQVVHRIVALLVLLNSLTLILHLWLFYATRPALLLLALTMLQVGLGIANAVLLLPLPLALAHNTGAALLLLMVVYINYTVFNNGAKQPEHVKATPVTR